MKELQKRQIPIILFFVSLSFLGSLSAQETTNVEVEGTETFDALRRKFAQELYTSQKPIEKKYIKALNRLLNKFAQKGDLESSLEVRKRIDHFEKFLKEYQEMIDNVLAEKKPATQLFPEFSRKSKQEVKTELQSEVKQ